MKRGLLIYRINRDDPANSGVVKKCKAQVRAFRQSNITVDMLWLCKDGVLINEELMVKVNIPPHSLKVYWFYFFHFGKIIQKLIQATEYDFVYLRHPFFDPLLDRALRNIKKELPAIKIILEINTYPYDAEPKRLLHWLSLKMDQYFRRKAQQYLDRIVDYGQQTQIWSIPTINIRNGIAIEVIKKRSAQPKAGRLRLIAVGNWSYWHGLDRLILGLKAYKGGIKVELKIVGEGPEKEKLMTLSQSLELEDLVQFIPATFGEDLDRLFDEADLGIGTLGLHRKSVELDSSLKHREYCARGLPFILASEDLDFPPSLSFVYHVPPNEKAINITAIIDWVEKSKMENIRNYAEKQLSWRKQLQPVFDWIKKQVN